MKAMKGPGARSAVALLLLSAALMALLGWSASAYYVPAACLALQAALVFLGRGFRLLRRILIVNLASGALLVLVLWLGTGLGARKLDVAGVALLVNLLCGGPLLGLLALPLRSVLAAGRSA